MGAGMLRQVTREVGIEVLGVLGFEARNDEELKRALLLCYLVLTSLRATLASLSGSLGDRE